MKNFLVVPTIRKQNISDFLKYWGHENWQIIIIEDNPTKTLEFPSEIIHLCWEDLHQHVGRNHIVFSRQDSGIRSFGFWLAHHMGADYIFTLDDDCLPLPNVSFIEEHIGCLEGTSRWTESVPGYRTRGLPYKNQGVLKNVVLNVGLWEGVPDFDAIQTLGKADPVQLPSVNRIIARGQYFPMCGMNMCFKREACPLMYFPLMGLNQPYRRFDDIWAGIIMKKVCDHLNLLVSVGKPFIYHSKASDPMTNLVKEAPGIAANETFWETIDEIELTSNDPKWCMNEMGVKLLEHSKSEYMSTLGASLCSWANLFPST